ncbi:N4-gp56 family major capsid protein [Bombilactobacillus mellis]|uniref:N4-gp56 family major capsid protein n=1 Tax=Bombilactobacillus mellis TaxID=1218508 RepID=UPI0015807A00|nr:N4-gp56 family major capsid protein [Bombilactobacillus mellis]NUF26339.1 N4-gp56 family major capsid protein [Bombilactobacillus mellis]
MSDITKLEDLINPQVLSPIVSYELKHALKFTPLANVDTTLVGAPGTTITMPAFTYLGDAADVPEGTPIPLHKLGTTEKQISIKKAGIGSQITDEAVLSGYGDPIKESTRQIGISIADKVDNDMLTAAQGGTQTVTMEPTVDGIQAGLDVFNDEDDAQTVLFVSPKTAALLRKDAAAQKVGSDIGANQLINGTYANILGVQIVRARKLKDTEALFIKQGALRLIMKRAVQVETQRDIINKLTIMTADEHYATYLYDETKVIVGTVGSGSAKSSK